MKNMDKTQFKNPLTNPVAISRVTLPLLNMKEDPLFIFYIGVMGEIHFYAFPIKASLNQEETQQHIEKAIRYIKMEYDKNYILVTRLEPGDFLTVEDVDKMIAERKAKVKKEKEDQK
jgi:hypothetical protein